MCDLVTTATQKEGGLPEAQHATNLRGVHEENPDTRANEPSKLYTAVTCNMERFEVITNEGIAFASAAYGVNKALGVHKKFLENIEPWEKAGFSKNLGFNYFQNQLQLEVDLPSQHLHSTRITMAITINLADPKMKKMGCAFYQFLLGFTHNDQPLFLSTTHFMSTAQVVVKQRDALHKSAKQPRYSLYQKMRKAGLIVIPNSYYSSMMEKILHPGICFLNSAEPVKIFSKQPPSQWIPNFFENTFFILQDLHISNPYASSSHHINGKNGGVNNIQNIASGEKPTSSTPPSVFDRISKPHSISSKNEISPDQPSISETSPSNEKRSTENVKADPQSSTPPSHDQRNENLTSNQPLSTGNKIIPSTSLQQQQLSSPKKSKGNGLEQDWKQVPSKRSRADRSPDSSPSSCIQSKKMVTDSNYYKSLPIDEEDHDNGDNQNVSLPSDPGTLEEVLKLDPTSCQNITSPGMKDTATRGLPGKQSHI